MFLHARTDRRGLVRPIGSQCFSCRWAAERLTGMRCQSILEACPAVLYKVRRLSKCKSESIKDVCSCYVCTSKRSESAGTRAKQVVPLRRVRGKTSLKGL